MLQFRRAALLAAALAFGLALSIVPAAAVIGTDAEHAVLMDAQTGAVLWEKDGYKAMPPASMSKLMTIELLFQRLKDGRVKLTDKFAVSAAAWKTGGSKGFVRVGDQLTVDDLIQRIIVASGNDACVVVAEALGGSVDGFVAMMNARAKELGLKQSHFVNPDGLPEPPGQLMSAYDLALLARHLVSDYPDYYHYFSEKAYTTTDQGKSITQPNRNFVLEKFPGADGLKTGYTDAAGYSVTASAVQGGRRMILVLGGLRFPDLNRFDPVKKDWLAEQRRGEEAARVLGVAFREFRGYRLFEAGTQIGSADVWLGSRSTVPLVLKDAVTATMPVDAHDHLTAAIDYDGPVPAPIASGARIATLSLSAPGWAGLEVPLYAGESVPSAGIIGRIGVGLKAVLGAKDAAAAPAH